MNPQDQTSRRDFLVAGTAAAAASALFAGGVHAAGSDEIKVGLIGCGGRGSGAAHDVLQAAKNVTIHALGDAFEDNLNGCRRRLEKYAGEELNEPSNKVDVAGRTFAGLDAYKKVIDSGCNYIILATPPGFRPIHLQAAVNAGKHVFTEKPVAVDGPGIRKVFDAYEEAKRKKLGIAAGTQRRHQAGYLETIKRIHDGEIGEIRAARCYWMQGILWSRKPKPGMTPLESQVHNWYNFTYLSGDHIVDQHVHNIDVINWRRSRTRARRSAWVSVPAPTRTSGTSTTSSPSISSTPPASMC